MQQTLFSYFRLLAFMGLTLICLQVPHYVSLYGNSLQSHWLESQQSLAQFRDEAELFFHGDIEQLIQHYQQSEDPVFQQGGQSLVALVDRYKALTTQLDDYQQSRWRAYLQALVTPVEEIRHEVMARFDYALQLNPQAIMVGLGGALLLTLLLEGTLRIPLLAFRRIRKPKTLAQKPTQSM